MSESNLKILYSLDKKNLYLKNIRHDIKKKRIIFDENKDTFGFDHMTQLIKVKNTSEVKGYPFKLYKKNCQKTHGIKFGVKIMPIDKSYDKKEHPCNLENLILKELTDNILNKGVSPHITYYLGTQKVANNSRAVKKLNLKRLEVQGKIRSHSNMLISEFVEGGSLDNWVYNTCENDQEISSEKWVNIVFQITYTIAIMQHYYKMMHNDCHYGNILIDDSVKPEGYFVYTINNKTFYMKNNSIVAKLWDFEYSMVYSNKIPECYSNKYITGSYDYDKINHKTIIDNSKLSESIDITDLNVPYNYNEVYDIHYFLTSLLDLYITQDIFDFIIQLYPCEVIPEDDISTKSYTKSSSRSKSSKSSSSTDSDSSDTNSSEQIYTSEGRLINGIEELFDLPTPLDILDNKFFERFTVKPDDFDENTAMYFNAGF